MINTLYKLFYRKQKSKNKPLQSEPLTLEEQYLKIGRTVGFKLSFIYMGEDVKLKDNVEEWSKLEKSYAKQGFRTISIDKFIEFGGYGKSINDFIGVKRDEGEEPIFHANIIKENYLGKIQTNPAIKDAFNGIQSIGSYQLPSTEK
jgi:hypothetical protein